MTQRMGGHDETITGHPVRHRCDRSRAAVGCVYASKLCGRLDVAIFIGSGVYGHASIMLDLGSKPGVTRYKRPPIR